MEKEVFERMVNEFEGVNEKVVKLRDFITDKDGKYVWIEIKGVEIDDIDNYHGK